MHPVSVAILATLLPSCLLIFGLAFLSVHLSIKLRALRAKLEDHRIPSPITVEAPPAPKPPPTPSTWPGPLPEGNRMYPLSNESAPNWIHDSYKVFSTLSSTSIWASDTRKVYTKPGVEARVGRTLEALGYHGHSPEFIVKLLRDRPTRFTIAEHVITTILLAKTDLERPESSLFPFSPELHRDLRIFFQALEGIKFSSEFSSILAKFPTQIARECGWINEKRMADTIELFQKLFFPLVKIELLPRDFSYPGIGEDLLRGDFVDFVTFRLRMLGSRQQFEFRWEDATEPYYCKNPAVYSHVGEDGVPLVEPKLWVESSVIGPDTAGIDDP